MPQPFSRHVAMAQWINASPIFRPRRSLATRTASIRPRRIPPRESPAMKLSCSVPTMRPSASATARNWLGSAEIWAKAAR